MSYDQSSFLQGLAVGKSLKGWSSGLGTAMPSAWNDEGVYSYFYLDYHLPISSITLSLFRLSTRIICEAGEIDVLNVEAYNTTTYKVYCDLTRAGSGWIAVMGYNSYWLYYDSGIRVPEYTSVFWLDSMQPWTPGYLEDTDTIGPISQTGSEETIISHHNGVFYETTESEVLPVPTYTHTETLVITYS